MNLSDVNRGIKKHKKPKRVGRGIGSGHGKTCGKGHKGQGSRAGNSRKPTFQGGAMPLVRRIPKRGFYNKFADSVAIVNVADLEKAFDDGQQVTPETLESKSLAQGQYDQLKILGNGDLNKKLTVSAHRFSQSALTKIEKAGGKVIVLPGKTTVAAKKKKAQTAAAD